MVCTSDDNHVAVAQQRLLAYGAPVDMHALATRDVQHQPSAVQAKARRGRLTRDGFGGLKPAVCPMRHNDAVRANRDERTTLR
jgi:hypothetical protein